MAKPHLQERDQAIATQLLEHVDGGGALVTVAAPPGSGKTWLTLSAVALARHRGRRVAVATQTNSQADDFCRRLAGEFPRFEGYRLLGGSAEPKGIGASIKEVPNLGDVPVGAAIVVATAAKWGAIGIAEPFDVLFVDEAWQMPWAEFMLCGQVAPRFVLVGDPGQIDPVVTVDVARWETARYPPHAPAPEVIRADPSIGGLRLELPASRRLPEDTVGVIRRFYDFEFEAWSCAGERRLVGSGLGVDPIDRAISLLHEGSIAALTIPTPDEGPPLEEDRELARMAVDVVTRLLRDTEAEIDGQRFRIRPEDIGISATHRVMNSRIWQLLPEQLRCHVRVDTPERWQGLECRVMIAVHPLSGVLRPSPFDLDTGRLCVMASRHTTALIILARDHLSESLETFVPSATQAPGRPDAAGRGHYQNLAFWKDMSSSNRVIAA